MKRLTVLLVAIVCLGAVLTSCQREGTNEQGVTVVTTAFPYYDFARQIAGDRAGVTLLLKPGAEPHSYEPSPADMLAIRSCDLFLYTGGESDAWVKGLLGASDGRTVNALALMDAVERREVEHDHDGETGHHTVTYDEHIWTSPVNAIKLTEAITEALVSIDPEGKAIYEANAAAYLEELRDLDGAYRSLANNAERRLLVFGDRFPFLYMTEEYGLDHAAAFSGCSEESEVSAATVAYLIQTVKENGVPVVLCTELSSGRIADGICRETGAVKHSLHSCANVTKDEAAAGESYLTLMRRNLAVLKTALGERDS
ncbi:MAG: zinc ABC transporter substrate-binding protein [Ruminococcaceae bacterium]|nr:zinc ABC transporter substrate-binding protein [Oscillospiraceae bacterium]